MAQQTAEMPRLRSAEDDLDGNTLLMTLNPHHSLVRQTASLTQRYGGHTGSKKESDFLKATDQ